MFIYPKKNSRGFTLLEVLLAISIISIVLVTVYSTFWGGIRLSNRAEENGGMVRDVRLTFELMKKDFENMIPYDFTGSYPDQFALMGESNQATIILATPQGLKAVRYVLSEQKEGSIHTVLIGRRTKKNVAVTNISQEAISIDNLVREEIPFVEYLSQSQKSVKREVISNRVGQNSLKFLYGANSEEGSGQIEWTDNWKKQGFPARVKVTLGFVSANQNSAMVSLTRDIFIPLGNLNKIAE